MTPNLIVMLTHNDVTVAEAQALFDACADLAVSHWGFKDVGLPKDEMSQLVASMRDAGKSTFLEVVSLAEDECMRGAQIAVECGFDHLMGTVFYESVFDFLSKHEIRYFPFCGTVTGHPSVLEGTVEEIVRDALKLEERGVHGIDLLAYRHSTSAEEVARKTVQELEIPVVLAGSIGSWERIDTMRDIAPWGFTIGSGLFDGVFATDRDFRVQLEAVLKYTQR